MADPVTRLNAALEGRYRIERQLGEGGMATVYLARGDKHNRNVALKVLKPELAAVVGAERFLAEIETTASLQHPHILPLFDSGEADGFLFYVMPYVEGESLRQKLDREHQLPVEEAVAIATNVAEALHYAHRHGVVHRDIKPANILMQSGKPVISDFGIALAVGVAGGGRLTETGLSLGTPHYMSPEQATGDLRVGAAADIYALGCVLYEMLMGEPPFTGSTAQAILGKIIAGERVSITAHRKAVPPNVDGAIRKALEKLPADRFRDASGFAAALGSPGFRHGLVAHPRDGTAGRGWRSTLPWGVAAAAAAAAVISLTFRPAGEEPVRYWGIAFPDSAVVPLRPLAPLGVPREALAVSPDGDLIVHSGFDGVGTRLYRRSLSDGFEHVPIPGTQGGHSPFFSPEGDWIGFFAGTQLWRVSLRGGEPEALVEASNPSGAFWTDSDEIVFTSNEGTYIGSIPANGGNPRELTPSELTGVSEFTTPKPLPGEDGILFLGWWPPTIMAMRLSEGVPAVLTEGVSPRYLPNGHLVFGRGNTLYGARFDPVALEMLSDPVPVLTGVRTESGMAQYEVSEDGTLYFVPGLNADIAFLSWVDTLGAVDTLSLPPREYQKTMVSPDGRRLASLVWGGAERVLIIDLETGATTDEITEPGITGPNWMPDGSGIVYTRASSGEVEPTVLVRRSLGSREEEVLHEAESAISVSSVSPDGQLVFFSGFSAGDPGDLSFVDADGQVETYVQTDASEWGATLSPNGQWVAYTSGESGQYQVYVEPFPVTGASRRRASVHDNSEEPVWSSDGTELYYRSSNRWWAVPIETEPELSPGQPRLAFEGAYLNVGERSYDLHPDGDRFLVIDVPADPSADELRVVTNWVNEVARLVSGADGG